MFDTADAYGPGDEAGAAAQGANETLIADLLDEQPGRALTGCRRPPRADTRTWTVAGWDVDSRPEHLKQAGGDASLARLGVDQIALWQHHRPDPKVSYDDVIATLKEIADSGKVAGADSPTPTPQQIGRLMRSWATRWSACRTSSIRASQQPARDRGLR